MNLLVVSFFIYNKIGFNLEYILSNNRNSIFSLEYDLLTYFAERYAICHILVIRSITYV